MPDDDQDTPPADPAAARALARDTWQPPTPGTLREAPPPHVARLVVAVALAGVPGADHASISITDDRGATRTIASTSDLAEQIDRLQHRERQGPCVDSLFQHATARTNSLDDDPRWPRFGPAAAHAGVHSMLSARLFATNRQLGALNLLGERVDAFRVDSERIVRAVAAQASAAVVESQRVAGVYRAVAERDAIARATAVLAQHRSLDDDAAFDLLVRRSRETGLRLVDVAHEVADLRDPSPPDG